MLDHDRYMAEALVEANRAFQMGEVPVGAVVVVGDKIVARSANSPITDIDPTAHAEMIALRAAAKALGNYRLPADSTLYVTVEPCTMCLGAIVHSRIGRVVYGASEPKAGVCESHSLLDLSIYNHRPEVMGGVREQECSRLMTDFFEWRRVNKKRLKQR